MIGISSQMREFVNFAQDAVANNAKNNDYDVYCCGWTAVAKAVEDGVVQTMSGEAAR